MAGPTLHALLVGIDRYEPPRLLDGGRIPSLQACVHDVERMEELLSAEPVALPAERIRKLISPQPWSGLALPSREELPTYGNLVRELEALCDRAGEGDQVLIHYSGHGARLPTVAPSKKGVRGKDECLVPCDVGSEGNFLRDVELYEILRRLAGRGVRTTLILDCCHSGGITRELLQGTVRGLGEVDASAPSQSLLGSWEDLASSLSSRTEGLPGPRGDEPRAQAAGGAFRHLGHEPGWFPQPEGCVLLAACRPTELAREFPFDGGSWSGALTHFLLQAVGDLEARPTYRWLHHRLLERIRSRFGSQTPVLEGDGDLLFLEGARSSGAEIGPEGMVEVVEVERLAQLARCKEREGLENPGTSSPLAGKLRADLYRLDSLDDWAGAEGSRPIPDGGAVAEGTLLCLLVRNDSPSELNFAVLDRQPDGGVTRVHPGPREGSYFVLDPGAEHAVFLRAGLPDWIREGRDLLKVVATTGPLAVDCPASHEWVVETVEVLVRRETNR